MDLLTDTEKIDIMEAFDRMDTNQGWLPSDIELPFIHNSFMPSLLYACAAEMLSHCTGIHIDLFVVSIASIKTPVIVFIYL